MPGQKFTCVKSIINRLKSFFGSSKTLRSSVPKSENKINRYQILSGTTEVSEKSRFDTETRSREPDQISVCRAGGTRGESVENIPCISNQFSPSCEEKLSDENCRIKYSECKEEQDILDSIYIKKVNCDLVDLPVVRQNLLSTSSPSLLEPKVVKIHKKKTTGDSNKRCVSTARRNSNKKTCSKKLRKRRKTLPDAVHKLKSGFLVASNHITDKMSGCKELAKVNLEEPITCKQTFKRCKDSESPKFSNDWRSTPKRQRDASFESNINERHLDRQKTVNEGAEFLVVSKPEQCNRNRANPIEPGLPNPILDYTFLSMDYFFTVVEQLHDHMDLVRNGIQQLIDNFTQPSIMRLQDQETRMLEFKQSVELLLQSIERMNYAMINLPDRISNMRYLLLPCKNTIREFNDHLQKMSIDFEHTQYFNNDSPMHTLLKMIVIIKILNAVLARGRRAFIRSADLQHYGSDEGGTGFDVVLYHERFLRPTFDMLFRRTEAMVKLRNYSVVLSQKWIENQTWNTFLPSLQEFMKLIKMVEPFLAVPQDWYAVRILPETRIMHVFDGFMSEFYRAIVTPDFANSNPVAFGSIFTVIQFILDNIINQHVIILRDLNTGLNLQGISADGDCIAETDHLANGSPKAAGGWQNSQVYENVQVSNNAPNFAMHALYQNV